MRINGARGTTDDVIHAGDWKHKKWMEKVQLDNDATYNLLLLRVNKAGYNNQFNSHQEM